MKISAVLVPLFGSLPGWTVTHAPDPGIEAPDPDATARDAVDRPVPSRQRMSSSARARPSGRRGTSEPFTASPYPFLPPPLS